LLIRYIFILILLIKNLKQIIHLIHLTTWLGNVIESSLVGR